METGFKLLLTALAIMSFMACEKNLSDPIITETQTSVLNSNLFMFDYITNEVSIIPFTTDLPRVQKGNSSNVSASGKFTSGIGSKFLLNAMRNPSGMHGSNTLTGPGLLQDVQFNSDCIFKMGNEAYIGGEITHWIIGTPPPGFPPVDVGWSIYFAFRDNGQGNNAPSDETFIGFYIAPPFDEDGNPFPPLCEEVFDAISNLPDPPQGFSWFAPGIPPTNFVIKGPDDVPEGGL